jgi:hypothetical protein
MNISPVYLPMSIGYIGLFVWPCKCVFNSFMSVFVSVSFASLT